MVGASLAWVFRYHRRATVHAQHGKIEWLAIVRLCDVISVCDGHLQLWKRKIAIRMSHEHAPGRN